MDVQGLVSVVSATGVDGQPISLQSLVDAGKLPNVKPPAGWGVAREEVSLGFNLTTLNLRQYICYLMGYKAPVSNYVCANFGLGTGTQAPNVTDVALQSPINFFQGGPLKPINGVDFPDPYVMRVSYTIALSEANGFLITEAGLFSGDGTLLARKTQAGLNKDSTFSPVLLWRVKF